MQTFTQILRTILFAALTILGMIMALVFMVTTIVAMGILYVAARLGGRPFSVRSYWSERRRHRAYQGFKPNYTRQQTSTKRTDNDVTDIEMREIP